MLQETNIIGTDASLEVCKREGYAMLEHPNEDFAKDEFARFFAYYPEYLEEETNGRVSIDTDICWNDIVKIYERHEQEINDFSEVHQHVNFESPTWYDLLTLADAVNAYCGLY